MNMGDPAPAETLASFPFLIGPYRRRGLPINRFIAAGQRGRHAADGYGAMTQANCNQPAEEIGQKWSRLDVHVEAVGPYTGGIGHRIFNQARL